MKNPKNKSNNNKNEKEIKKISKVSAKASSKGTFEYKNFIEKHKKSLIKLAEL